MDNLEFLKTHLKNQNLIKHCIAVKAIMGSLAERFNEDKEKWGTTGLLHDIDVDEAGGDLSVHSKLGAEILQKAGYPEDICRAVLTHNEAHGIKPETLMAKALYCSDPISGLIIAATLVLPSKKLSDLKPESVVNRFYEKSFAKGANREIIKKCEEFLNLSLAEFAEISLQSMQRISGELGL